MSATQSDVLKAQGFASTEIISRWHDIVGLEIAGHSEPLKINWPRAPANDKPEPATLVLRVEGPAALEIQHLSEVILDRVRLPALSLTSRTTICARRSAGWVRRSREIELFERLGRPARHCHNCAIQLANTLNLTGV